MSDFSSDREEALDSIGEYFAIVPLFAFFAKTGTLEQFRERLEILKKEAWRFDNDLKELLRFTAIYELRKNQTPEAAEFYALPSLVDTVNKIEPLIALADIEARIEDSIQKLEALGFVYSSTSKKLRFKVIGKTNSQPNSMTPIICTAYKYQINLPKFSYLKERGQRLDDSLCKHISYLLGMLFDKELVTPKKVKDAIEDNF